MKKVNYYFEGAGTKINQILPKKSWILNCVKKENKSILKIDFIFCSDMYLKKLNKKHLAHNTLTDVITLDYSTNEYLLGDVFISIERVKENAQIYKMTLENEISRVMIHGVLHLIGYKDRSNEQKKIMRKKENKYLEQKNI